MPLEILKKDTIKKLLTEVWKKDLNTNKDPANGKWYEKGAGGSTIGLYGGIDDSTTSIQFGKPQNSLPDIYVCDSHIFDNRDGLMPQATASLNYTYHNETSILHAKSDTINAGVSTETKGSVSIPVVTVEKSYSIKVDYAYNWSKSESSSKSIEFNISQTIPVTIPEGKVYLVELTALSCSFEIPYTARIEVTGNTETWFEDRVKRQGEKDAHYNFIMSANTAFKKIRDWNIAGSESSNFSERGYEQHGKMTGQLKTAFTARVIDITNSYKNENIQLLEESQNLASLGTVIREVNINH